MESDPGKVRRVSRAGSRFALFMLVMAIVLGTVLTSMSAVQLVQVRRFAHQILDMRARTAAVSFFWRYARNPVRTTDRVQEVVSESNLGAPDFVQVLDTSGRVLGTSQGDATTELIMPSPADLEAACRRTIERLDSKLPWKKNGTVRLRRALVGTLLVPSGSEMRTVDGQPLWDVLFAVPSPDTLPPPPPDMGPPPGPGAPLADRPPHRKMKGPLLERSRLLAPEASCMIVRVGVDATPQRNALRTHWLILGLALLTTLLILGINIALYRTLKQRERMAESLERAKRVQSLGEMAATLAHELKNPVGAIRGYAQLMREAQEGIREDDPDAEKVKRAVETIVRESTRLEQLVAHTLEYARPGELDLEKVDLREVADAAANLMAGKASSREVSIVTDHDSSPVAARVDRDRIEQVIANLLDNAIAASPAGESIVLRATTEGATARVVVRDRGEGIPGGDLEKIFQPFHTTRTDGTGLGLAVSRSIVEAHRGTLAAGSEGTGQGATFTITLPR